MPTFSRSLAAATAVLTLAVATAVVPRPAAGAPQPPTPSAEPVEIDDGAARPNPLDASLLPAGLADEATAASSQKGVEQLRPDGSSGFLPFDDRARSYGAYRFQLVTSGSDGDIERLRPALEQVAAELTGLSNVTYSVDAGQIPRPTSVNRFPPGYCGQFGGHRCSLYDDADTSIGVIRVSLSSGSACGPLAPAGTQQGIVGCGGPESVFRPDGTVVHLRGNVWLSPSLVDVNAPQAMVIAAHEIGHAIGLNHFGGAYTAVPGATPVRQLMYPRVHEDPSDIASTYRSGDAQGIWYLHPIDAWYITATYRDFLGRIPDTVGYRHWIASVADRAGYVDALTTSDEWVGRIVHDFYDDVFGRPPDPGGFSYWTGLVRAFGVPFVAGQLYGSSEYLARQGGSTTGFVQALYRQLLGRDAAADPQGLAYWVSLADQQGRVPVAAAFYQSTEKRRDRVRALYCTLLDRPPDPAGQAHWAEVILVRGDLALASDLATSGEYATNADEYALLPLAPRTPPGC